MRTAPLSRLVSPSSPLLVAVLLAALPDASLAAQGQARTVAVANMPAPTVAGMAQASAVHAATAPVLDGRGTDAVWQVAPRITDFKVYDPTEGATPVQRTTVQVAFDDRHLYVLVRAHDTAPDSIRGLLSRRDVGSPSDWVRVMVDSYHDRRTGYQFVVNPAGVKRDIYIFNDGNEDLSWDAVWHVETAIDSGGWTAEYAIPWSQLRYPAAAQHTIGLMVIRDVARANERQSWPLWRRNSAGFVSQFGEVSGITNLPSRRRAELMPYVVQKQSNRERAAAEGGDGSWTHRGQLAIGADAKVGITSNFTLDATINPDFGQVEADPATFNLSTTENYFAERRPFFMEGMGIFRFDMSCDDGECRGLFYSRRVGQAPRLLGSFGDASSPTQTTILGAAKVTGRTNGGLSVGLLNALTQREEGMEILDADDRPTGDRYVVEPLTNFLVGRVQQEFRQGNTTMGAMATNVVRRLDDVTDDFIRRQANTAGLDVQHRFAAKRYQLSGFLAGSRIDGSTDAIARTQRGNVHRYDRVDADHLRFDPTRTSLEGGSGQLFLNKVGGLLRLSSGYTYTSPGFDINDAGFQQRADEQQYSNWAGVRFLTPRAFYRMLGLNVNQWTSWDTHGMRTDLGGNVNGHLQLKNNWFVFGGTGLGQFSSYNDRDARGGPAFRRAISMNNWTGFETDGRRAVSGGFQASHGSGDEGRSGFFSFGPRLTVRPSTRFSLSASPRFSRNIDDSQWYSNGFVATAVADTTPSNGIADPVVTASAYRYMFAHLDQKTTSMTTRIDFTATPTLSLQLYASPFMTRGGYTDIRRLSDDPRSRDYERRFVPLEEAKLDGTSGPLEASGFDFKQFNSNTVLRWEYRPGSTLFLVWAQGRLISGSLDDPRRAREFDPRGQVRDLFRAHPSNTFIIKGSYWLGF